MRKQKNVIRLCVVCWGTLSVVGGSCLMAVSFWRDEVAIWVRLLPGICAILMFCLLRIAVREARGMKGIKVWQKERRFFAMRPAWFGQREQENERKRVEG